MRGKTVGIGGGQGSERVDGKARGQRSTDLGGGRLRGRVEDEIALVDGI